MTCDVKVTCDRDTGINRLVREMAFTMRSHKSHFHGLNWFIGKSCGEELRMWAAATQVSELRLAHLL